MRVQLAALSLVASAACGDPIPARTPIELRGTDASTWRYGDGLTLSKVVVPTHPVEPGAEVAVAFEASARGTFEVAWMPPRAAGREVAVGGPDAPPVEVAEDGRVRRVQVAGEGVVSVTLPVPAPWHPKTGVIVVRRLEGGRARPVVQGARRRSGEAVLAVVDVSPRPTAVTAARAASLTVDGRPDEPDWQRAARVPMVGSLDGEPVRMGATREDDPDWGPTQVAFAWDEAALYVAGWLPDRDIRATLTERDDPIWKEEVFEVFVFGDERRARYLELQVSPRGVLFDAKFERYRKGDESWTSSFDAAVAVDGTIEAPDDVDDGWTTEFAIPWSEICAHTEVACPPGPGTSLRLNTFRFERPRKGAAIGLALSPTRVPDFHAPENAAVLELLP